MGRTRVRTPFSRGCGQSAAAEAGARAAVWAARGQGDDAAALAARLRPLIDRLLRATLAQLYPQSPVPEPELAGAGHSA